MATSAAPDAVPVGEDFKENLNNILVCPDCKEYPPNLIEEFSSGDVVCGSCGVVLGDRIVDTRSEWRTFANDDQNNDDPSRVGDAGNPLFEDTVSTLQTSIGREGANSIHLMRTQQKTVEKGAKSQSTAFQHIKSLTEALECGAQVRDSALHIYKLVDEKKFLKGKPQDAVIAGCIFIACRQGGASRTFREIYNLTHVSKKEIGRVFKLLEKWLMNQKAAGGEGSGSIVSSVTTYAQKGSTSADELVTRYVSQLPLRNHQPIEKVAKDIASRTAQVSTLAGRSPLSVAAAAIFMASHLMGEPKPSREISAVAGVSDGTIKTAYKYLYAARDQLIDQKWLSPGQGSMDRLPSS